MTGVYFTILFIVMAIAIAPFDTVSAFVCIGGAFLSIIVTWYDLS